MTDLQLKFNLRVEVGDNEIHSCIYALVITNRLWKQAVTLFSSCFWRTSLWWWCKHHVKTIAKIHSDISGVLRMLCYLHLYVVSTVALNEHHRCLFSYSFETKCVNVAVIYVLYALKLKLWQKSSPVSTYLLLRNETTDQWFPTGGNFSPGRNFTSLEEEFPLPSKLHNHYKCCSPFLC